MGTWRRFWCLRAADRRIAVEASAALTATYVGLRLAGFQRWRTLLEWLAPGEAAAGPDSSSVAPPLEIARMEAGAARHLFFRTNCLEQSLALWWLLRRRRVPANLRIGARKQQHNFEAHAWVELDGAVLNDPDDSHLHFSPFEGPATFLETQAR